MACKSIYRVGIRLVEAGNSLLQCWREVLPLRRNRFPLHLRHPRIDVARVRSGTRAGAGQSRRIRPIHRIISDIGVELTASNAPEPPSTLRLPEHHLPI